MYEFNFDFRDIFRVPRLAFSLRRILTHFRALIIAFFLYNVFSYLALIVSGVGFTSAFARYYLFPPLLMFGDIACGGEGTTSAPCLGIFIQFIGILAFILINYVAGAATSKITLEQLRGNGFYTVKESRAFVRRNRLAIIAPPVVIFLVIAVFVGITLLFGAVGLIPYAGELMVSLSAVPLYFVGLLILLFSFVGLYAFVLTPAIVGCTGGDTFETTFELFSTATNRPLRLVVYETIHLVFGALGFLLFAVASVLALWFFITPLTAVMGPKFLVIFATAWNVLPSFVKYLFSSNFLGGILSWFKPGYIEMAGPPGVWSSIVATLFAFGLYSIIGIIVSYGLSIHNVGQTIIYVVLRKNKDDENLLETFDDEYEEALMREAAQASAEIKRQREDDDKESD
ncbi:MAG: hypothetical protein GY771_14275 [bacterium]|nr:hypothetical protein [bacterium]